MFCIPRVVERKGEHIYFRVHPNVEKAYQKQIASPTEAGKAGYRLSLDLEEGEMIDIGGYKIWRKGKRIITDRTAVFAAHDSWRMQAETPEIREGDHLDIYVDQNLIEIYVNNGEYVLSSVVYGLSTEIKGKPSGEWCLYAAESNK